MKGKRELTPKIIIERYLKENGISKASVAKKLNISQQNFQNQMNKSHLSTGLILDISKAIHYNLFTEIADYYNDEIVFFDLGNELAKPAKVLTPMQNLEADNRRLMKMMGEMKDFMKENMVQKNEVQEQLKYLQMQIDENVLKKEKENIRLKISRKNVPSGK